MKQSNKQSNNRMAKAIFGIFLLQNLYACQEGNLNALEEELTIGALDIVSITVTAPVATSGLMPINETLPFIATGIKSTGETTDITTMPTLTWSVSDSNLATIDNSTGVLSSKATAATVTVSATISTIVGSESVTISDSPLTSIAVFQADGTTVPLADLSICSELQLSAIGTYTGFNWDVTKTTTWSATEGKITVNGGLFSITDIKTPPITSTTITASKETVTTPVTFTVNDDLSSIAITSSTLSLPVNTTTPFSAKATREDSTIDDITTISNWSETDPTIATVSPTTGVVTSIKTGNTSITAECGGKNPAISDTVTVTVTDSAKLERIEITSVDTAGFYTINSGGKKQLLVTAYYTNSEVTGIEDDPNTSYTNTPIRDIIGSPITVNGSGLVTAGTVASVSVAEVVVTFTSNGIVRTDDVVFKVNP